MDKYISLILKKINLSKILMGFISFYSSLSTEGKRAFRLITHLIKAFSIANRLTIILVILLIFIIKLYQKQSSSNLKFVTLDSLFHYQPFEEKSKSKSIKIYDAKTNLEINVSNQLNSLFKKTNKLTQSQTQKSDKQFFKLIYGYLNKIQ